MTDALENASLILCYKGHKYTMAEWAMPGAVLSRRKSKPQDIEEIDRHMGYNLILDIERKLGELYDLGTDQE